MASASASVPVSGLVTARQMSGKMSVSLAGTETAHGSGTPRNGSTRTGARRIRLAGRRRIEGAAVRTVARQGSSVDALVEGTDSVQGSGSCSHADLKHSAASVNWAEMHVYPSSGSTVRGMRRCGHRGTFALPSPLRPLLPSSVDDDTLRWDYGVSQKRIRVNHVVYTHARMPRNPRGRRRRPRGRGRAPTAWSHPPWCVRYSAADVRSVAA